MESVSIVTNSVKGKQNAGIEPTMPRMTPFERKQGNRTQMNVLNTMEMFYANFLGTLDALQNTATRDN